LPRAFWRGARVNSAVCQLFTGAQEGPGVFGVMVSSLNIIQDRLSRSRLAGDPPDVLLAPRLGHVGLLEFDRAAESIDIAQAAVEAAMPALYDALRVLGHHAAPTDAQVPG
jgi:NTE family protein